MKWVKHNTHTKTHYSEYRQHGIHLNWRTYAQENHRTACKDTLNGNIYFREYTNWECKKKLQIKWESELELNVFSDEDIFIKKRKKSKNIFLVLERNMQRQIIQMTIKFVQKCWDNFFRIKWTVLCKN